VQDKQHLLVIRFSSFGDIVQAIAVPIAFREKFPEAQIDWLVREDFKSLLTSHPAIHKVISFSRDQGLFALIQLAWRLGGRDYSYVYDAHNNVRSQVVTAVMKFRWYLQCLAGRSVPHFVRRSKDRLRRWLFFQFRYKTLPTPFRGAESFLKPLSVWGISSKVPNGPQFFANIPLPDEIEAKIHALPRPLVALAPSAAWQMKRWPVAHWKKLIRLLPNSSFVFLGGPEDHFINELELEAPNHRSLNLAGALTLEQSAAVLKYCELLIAGDTGIMHTADQMERPTIALIGPTAFGYPSHSTSQTLEIELSCKPCSKDGRGRCVNSLYQRCMIEINPERVATVAQEILGNT